MVARRAEGPAILVALCTMVNRYANRLSMASKPDFVGIVFLLTFMAK